MASTSGRLRDMARGISALGYLGWRMVAIGFVILFFAFGGPVSSIPMLYAEVMREFGWNSTEATLIYTFSSAGGAFVALALLGRLIDRFGLRAMLIAFLLMQAGGMASLLAVNSLASYYLAGLMMGLGQGTNLICVMLLVTRWFTRHVGLACGIAMMGSSLGGVFFPQLVNQLLPAIGWRYTFAGLGVGIIVIGLPLALVARYQPSEEELLREAVPDSDLSAQDLRAADLGLSFGQVLRMPMFWLVAAAVALTSAVDQGVFQHTALFLTKEVRLSSAVAATAISVIFAIGFFAKLVAGRVFDKLSIRGVALWYVLVAMAILLAFIVTDVWTAMLFAGVRGFVHGGLVSETSVVGKHCFGPRLLNRVLPFYAGCFSLGSGIGPVSLAAIYDATGSYSAGFIIFAVVALAAALLLVRVRPLYRDRLQAAISG